MRQLSWDPQLIIHYLIFIISGKSNLYFVCMQKCNSHHFSLESSSTSTSVYHFYFYSSVHEVVSPYSVNYEICTSSRSKFFRPLRNIKRTRYLLKFPFRRNNANNNVKCLITDNISKFRNFNFIFLASILELG